MSGWAALTPGYVPAQRIVAFVHGKARFEGAPDQTRPDVATLQHVDPQRHLGFGFVLPGQLFEGDRQPPEVYALGGGVATRLDWWCAPTARQALGC
jgi:hypothetical protein